MEYGIPADQPFTIRNAKPEDYPFILTSWSNEVHHLKYDNFIPNSIFFPRQKTLINKILHQSIVQVAHLDGEPDEIAGYIVLEPRSHIKSLLIHWAHVKPLYRRIGLFKGLLTNYVQDADPILVATSPFSLLSQFKKRFNLIYDPSAIDNLRGP